jgi:hypothetical protein
LSSGRYWRLWILNRAKLVVALLVIGIVAALPGGLLRLVVPLNSLVSLLLWGVIALVILSRVDFDGRVQRWRDEEARAATHGEA